MLRLHFIADKIDTTVGRDEETGVGKKGEKVISSILPLLQCISIASLTSNDNVAVGIKRSSSLSVSISKCIILYYSRLCAHTLHHATTE